MPAGNKRDRRTFYRAFFLTDLLATMSRQVDKINFFLVRQRLAVPMISVTERAVSDIIRFSQNKLLCCFVDEKWPSLTRTMETGALKPLV